MSIREEVSPFGVFVRPGFLSAEECAELANEMAAAPAAPTPVYSSDAGAYVDAAHIRSVRTVSVRGDKRGRLVERLAEVLPDLAAHFDAALSGFEPVNFLRYVEGDHFEAHRDSSDEAMEKHAVRRVSIVVFVNDHEANGPARSGTFAGGELVLCVFGDDPRAALLGVDVLGEAGTLVAFPSSLVHQVKPVTRGERYSLVTWAG